MKFSSLVAIAALFSSVSAMAVPTSPITSVSCTAGVTNCTTAADGFSPAKGDNWRDLGTTAWWSSMGESVTFNLNGTQTLTGLTAVLDNNDTYQFQSMVGGVWTTFATVLYTEGTIDNGMDSFTKTFAPVTTSQVRLIGSFGDGGANNAFSVGEVSFTVAAVPEPGTIALLAAGLGVVGFTASRRRNER